MNSTIERIASRFAALCLVALAAAGAVAEPEVNRWNDDQLVLSYRDLVAEGGPDAAILAPTLPKDPPQATFLEALAWYAAGAPDKAGTLTRAQLDTFVKGQGAAYKKLLADKVERGASHDYPRTRTWKVIQKLTLLEQAMAAPPHEGSYAYRALPRASAGSDPWEVEHTLRSEGEFGEKVCRASMLTSCIAPPGRMRRSRTSPSPPCLTGGSGNTTRRGR